MEKKPRVLFSTPRLKHPAVGGPYLRIENSIKALSEITELHIHCRVALDDPTSLPFYKTLCHGFFFAPSVTPINYYISFFKRVSNHFSRKLIKKNIFEFDVEFKKDSQDLIKVADSIKADLIWLGYGNISYPLLKYIKNNSNYKVILDTDSVWSRFILRGLSYANNEKEREKIEQSGKEKEKEEIWSTYISDVTTAVSEVDANYYRNLAKQPRQIHLFSNVIDMETYQQVPEHPVNFKKPCIYLAGTFGPKSPMDDAARWVIEEILPLVHKKIPNIHFYIVGANSDQTLSDIKDPKITITGEMPSVLPYLCHSDVAIVPLRFESGTRFKILEAGACKIPIVSTTLGAEGLAVENGKHILIADEPRSFADAIIGLIENQGLAENLSENCFKLVEERYSINAAIKEAREILNAII